VAGVARRLLESSVVGDAMLIIRFGECRAPLYPAVQRRNVL